MRFDRSSVGAFLALVAARLDGEWLVIGDAAAAARFRDDRVTEDLDLIGLGGTQAERFGLMELASAAGLPIEAVNSAADYVVRKIPDWRAQLVPLTSARATIYRPSATLFILLKLGRLSEIDLDDCERLIAHCETSGETIDLPRLRAELAALPTTADVALAERRAQLARSLDPT